jgi:RHS repeat-associated protein
MVQTTRRLKRETGRESPSRSCLIRTNLPGGGWGRTPRVTTQYLSGGTVTYGHAIEYGYDIAGNKTLSRLWPQGSASGIATTYSYDANSRMQYVFHPDGERTEYTYTNVGSVASVSRRKTGGTGAVIASTAYTYNAKSFLTRVEHKNGSGVVTLALDYVVDTSGKRTQMTETRLGQSSQVTNYVYDAAGRLTSETVVGVRTTVFVYDKVGNRVTQSVTPAGGSTTSQSYSYDANDRLVSDGQYTYGYNAKGELTSRSQGAMGPVDEYAYTFEGRLSVQRHRASPMAAPTRQTLYSYDASGNRVGLTHQVSSNGTNWSTVDSTAFLVDGMQPYSEVAGEWDEVNVRLRAYYDIGLDRLRVVRDNAPANGPPSWVSRWYLLDGLGSTRSLVDDSGVVQDGYRYDAFGTPTTLAGGSGFSNAFLFNGQQWDDAVGGGAGAGFTEGIYFLRARYYTAGTGRFLSQDPFEGVAEYPSSLHRYRYAANDPVLLSDPDGNFEGIIGFLAASGIAQQIRAQKTAADFKVYKFSRDVITNGLQNTIEVEIYGFIQSIDYINPLSPFSDWLGKQNDEVAHQLAYMVAHGIGDIQAEEFFTSLRTITKRPMYGQPFAGSTTFGELEMDDVGAILVERNIYPSALARCSTQIFESIIDIATSQSAWQTQKGMGIHAEGVLAGKCKAFGLQSRTATLRIDQPFCADCNPESVKQMVRRVFRGTVSDEISVFYRTNTTQSPGTWNNMTVKMK